MTWLRIETSSNDEIEEGHSRVREPDATRPSRCPRVDADAPRAQECLSAHDAWERAKAARTKRATALHRGQAFHDHGKQTRDPTAPLTHPRENAGDSVENQPTASRRSATRPTRADAASDSDARTRARRQVRRRRWSLSVLTQAHGTKPQKSIDTVLARRWQAPFVWR